MTQTPPIIQDGILIYQQDGKPAQVTVDSSSWYTWLGTAFTFTFRGEHGNFTARKERAGNRRGRPYWRAYHTQNGKLHRVYLGQSEELTLQRLHTVAVQLAITHDAAPSPTDPDLIRESTPLQANGAEKHTRQPHETNRPLPKLGGDERSSRHTVQSYLSHLPIPLTPLIGREQEQAALCRLLRQPEVRLVTLAGAGGVGKTRLALQVAADLRADFANGVCFVPLAPVRDPEGVLVTLAQTLGLWEAADRSLLEQVQEYLREKHLLLLLDNFEQVFIAAPRLVQLLSSCPHLSILVTSRTALHLSGECEFTLPPLALPDLTHATAYEELAQVAAVRLFIERVQAIQPGFQLNSLNARVIAEICARLDGLPLAIEQAAARIKLLPPQALLNRLSNRLEVLTGGAQDLPSRQQTLRNTLQWSYNLLSQQEQRLFRRLSVFIGGFTLAAATAIIQTMDSGHNSGNKLSMEVLEGVASLIDKHLLQQMAQEDEEPRLMMLETIREYGIERLQQCGELAATQQAYVAFYLQFMQGAFGSLFNAEAAAWFEQVEQEYGNLRAVLEWALGRGDEVEGNSIEVAAQLGSLLWRFWTMRGYLSEGRTMLERMLAASTNSSPDVRAKILYALTVLVWFQEEYERLKELGEEQLDLSQRIGDQSGIALALCGLAGAAFRQGDNIRAQALSEQSVTAARAAENPYLNAALLLFLGRLVSNQGDHARAQILFEESLSLMRGMGYQGDIAWPLIYLARELITQGEHTRARVLLEEAVTLCRTVQYKWALAHALGFLGQVLLEQNSVTSASEYLTESLRLNQEVGNRRSIAWSLFLLASIVAMEGKGEEARALYEQGLSIAIDLEHRGLIASCLQGLAALMTVQGQFDFAAHLWGKAEATHRNSLASLPHTLRNRVEQARVLAHTYLGGKSFASALTEGRMMTLEQIFAALKIVSTQPTSQIELPRTSLVRRTLLYPAELTVREVEVLRLVAQGLTNAQVAKQLVISPRTVNWHLSSVYSKIQVSSRAAATRFAIEHSLV